MKIGFDGRVLKRTEKTGVERYADRLYRELSKLCDVCLLSPKISGNFGHIWTQSGLIFQSLRNHLDVLLCPSTTIPLMLPKAVKVVVTIHDINFLLYPDLYSKRFRSYFATLLPLIISRADGIICVSDYTKETVCSRYPSAIGKVRTIHCAAWNHCSYTNVDREPIILSVASYNPNKNIARLVEAFGRVSDRIPHRLLLVGQRRPSVSESEDFEGALAKCPPGRVEFLGFVDDAKLCELYSRAQLFVFPSICEGFGVPPLEAMASGCPVLGANTSSIPEVCGEAALYCDPLSVDDMARKLELLATSESLRVKLREAGLYRSRDFSFLKCASETFDFCLDVLTHRI